MRTGSLGVTPAAAGAADFGRFGARDLGEHVGLGRTERVCAASGPMRLGRWTAGGGLSLHA
jgi:hypothetical protein